ncbi:MAG TPA: hypothetical protein VFQ67_12975 [Allosphingosinicella sp.]|jgi:hypothetical protein|nr:hypothetical protein [Allosphingosinicella sp.]
MKQAFFQRLAGRSWLAMSAAMGVSLVAGAVAVQGEPRTSVHPYLQVEQVATMDFDRGEVLTYTGVGGGVEAAVATRRLQATISVDYQHRVGWNDRLNDHDVVSGLAAAHFEAVPGVLSLDAGAMAARTHADIRVPVPAARTIDSANVAEIYSAYAGPTLTTHAGPVSVGASYRLGYVKVDDHSLAGTGLPPGAPRVDRYSSSTVHNATVSFGMAPGRLPFGWTVGAGYVREDMNRLDSSFEAEYVRGDVVVPVSPTLAVTGGVGYETMQGSQQDFLRTPGGLPVLTPAGNLIPDPSRPRLRTVDQDGIMWDAGIIWRPSPRTELQARGGWRYGGESFTASLAHKINSRSSLNASVYDSVSSFGRLLVADLNGLPTKFQTPSNGLTGAGCVFGNDPGTGRCFGDAFQSISNFNFRNRGASLQYSTARGPWTMGLGAGYANRKYLAPDSSLFALNGVTDQSFSLQGNLGRRLTRSSGYDLGGYAAWFDSGIADADASFGAGLTGRYYRNIFRDRLQAQISAGLYTTQAGEFDASYGSILVGLRYTF